MSTWLLRIIPENPLWVPDKASAESARRLLAELAKRSPEVTADRDGDGDAASNRDGDGDAASLPVPKAEGREPRLNSSKPPFAMMSCGG